MCIDMAGASQGSSDRPSSAHYLTINGNVGNIASIAQDNASQTANGVGGNAIAKQASCGIASIPESGKLAQADGEGLLRSLLGPAASELGQMAGIQAYFWKMDLLQACLEKAAETLQRLGIEPKQVKSKFLKPLLEGAAMEDEPELQELWANLIATTAATGETHPAFAKILAELTPADALCLQEFEKRGFPRSDDRSNTQLCLDNLVHLGLCKEEVKLQSKEKSRMSGLLAASPWSLAEPPFFPGLANDEPYRLMKRYAITDLGHCFFAAVQGPQASK